MTTLLDAVFEMTLDTEISDEIPFILNTNLSLSIKPISSHLLKAIVMVPAQTVLSVKEHVIEIYQNYVRPKGLEYSNTPLSYINDKYAQEINECLKRFILKHLVLDYLLNTLITQQIRTAHHPRLTNMELSVDDALLYTFNVSSADIIKLKDWKLFNFKAPKRKLYKDLDKQVENFIEREATLLKKQSGLILEDEDWACFEAHLLNKNQDDIIQPQGRFWMKLRTRNLASKFQQAFLGKKISDSFITTSFPLDEDMHEIISAQSPFKITIHNICKGLYFSIENFKKTFKLKNKQEAHRKLIEVFSYRNDISQRRSTIEEIFHLFFSRHRFEIPKHLILRKQEDILLSLRKVPDYHVYKAQKDFLRNVESLAEKQLKEEILINQIAADENIKVSDGDIQGYLHLFNGERLKEFVYFKPFSEPLEELDTPFHEAVLREAVVREKTLNHIIHILSR